MAPVYANFDARGLGHREHEQPAKVVDFCHSRAAAVGSSVEVLIGALMQGPESFAFGPYVLERAEWRLRRGDDVVPLPPKALSLLFLLVQRAGSLVTREEILAIVWQGTHVESGNVAFYIAMLRKALSEPPDTTYIETVKTKGYRFVAPVVRPEPVWMAREQSHPPAVTTDVALGADTVASAPPVSARAGHHRAALLLLAATLTLATGIAWMSAPRTPPTTANGEAFALVVQAREQWKRRTPHSVQQAIALYERAIAIEPQFVPAYAGLADCYNLAMSGQPPALRYALAKANAEKAVALDPQSAAARTSLAFMRYKFEWRWRDAEAEFQRAIALDPRYALARHWYGELLGLMGRFDEGIAELEHALELDPTSLAIRSDLASTLLRARRFSDAKAALEGGLAIDPNWYQFPMRMEDIFAAERRDRDSAEATWRGMTLRGVPLRDVDELRAAFDTGGMPAMIRAQIQQYLRQDAGVSATSFAAMHLSFLYARLGEHAEALRWLETSIERREDAPLHMLTHPAYDSLRDVPRFREMLARLELSQAVTIPSAPLPDNAPADHD
jgi:DNA-binding winged helix-turn-helix (wHTH) protein